MALCMLITAHCAHVWCSRCRRAKDDALADHRGGYEALESLPRPCGKRSQSLCRDAVLRRCRRQHGERVCGRFASILGPLHTGPAGTVPVGDGGMQAWVGVDVCVFRDCEPCRVSGSARYINRVRLDDFGWWRAVVTAVIRLSRFERT